MDQRPIWMQLNDEHGTLLTRPNMPADQSICAIRCGDRRQALMRNCYITVGLTHEENYLLQLYTHDLRFTGTLSGFTPQNLWNVRHWEGGYYTFESRHAAGLFMGVGDSRTFGEPVILQNADGFRSKDEYCWRLEWLQTGYVGRALTMTNRASGGAIYSPYDPSYVRGYDGYTPAPLCHGPWRGDTGMFSLFMV